MARHKGLMGSVELLGLNAFGGEISPLWGAIIGGGAAGVTSMTLGHINNGQYAGNREMYGFLAGLGAAGVMALMPSTKRAAFGAVVGAFLGSGLAWLEKVMLGTVQLPVATAATAAAVAAVAPAAAQAAAGGVQGFGMARVHALNGLKGLGMARVHALNGLGIPSIANQPKSVGTIPGVAGPAFAGTQMGGKSPVNLLGGPSTRSNQISLMGGPQIHGLSAAYGATLLGGNG